MSRSRDGNEGVAPRICVGNVDLLVSIHVTDFGRVCFREKPQFPIGIRILRRHRTALQRTILIDGGHHGYMNAFNLIVQHLYIVFIDITHITFLYFLLTEALHRVCKTSYDDTKNTNCTCERCQYVTF